MHAMRGNANAARRRCLVQCTQKQGWAGGTARLHHASRCSPLNGSGALSPTTLVVETLAWRLLGGLGAGCKRLHTTSLPIQENP
jgi:hypothetical protein